MACAHTGEHIDFAKDVISWAMCLLKDSCSSSSNNSTGPLPPALCSMLLEATAQPLQELLAARSFDLQPVLHELLSVAALQHPCASDVLAMALRAVAQKAQQVDVAYTIGGAFPSQLFVE